MRKNFEYIDKMLINNLKKEVKFKFTIKSSENRVHWIVQLPSLLYESLISKARVYMMWRTYKVKEYLSIIKCFKCHGHFARNCEIPKQLRETCRDKDHLKADCHKKDTPFCINCIRGERKETNIIALKVFRAQNTKDRWSSTETK